jgi:hypothetical protein
MPSHRRRLPFAVIVPRPDRVRTLDGVAFGWLDAALHRTGWLRVLSLPALATYAFLCLVADRQGVSFYRRGRIGRELGLDDGEVASALARLIELDLVAYRPFRDGAADGFHQVLSLPEQGPPPWLPAELVQPCERLLQRQDAQADR